MCFACVALLHSQVLAVSKGREVLVAADICLRAPGGAEGLALPVSRGSNTHPWAAAEECAETLLSPLLTH